MVKSLSLELVRPGRGSQLSHLEAARYRAVYLLSRPPFPRLYNGAAVEHLAALREMMCTQRPARRAGSAEAGVLRGGLEGALLCEVEVGGGAGVHAAPLSCRASGLPATGQRGPADPGAGHCLLPAAAAAGRNGGHLPGAPLPAGHRLGACGRTQHQHHRHHRQAPAVPAASRGLSGVSRGSSSSSGTSLRLTESCIQQTSAERLW